MKPRTFTHFPENSVCPVCATNADEESVLIPIVGTEDDGICEGQPVHLGCAVIQRWDKQFNLGYVLPQS
jgi:hypothetical protein